MTTFQMIMLGLGALLGASTFWEQIKGGVSAIFKGSPKVDPTVEVSVSPIYKHSRCKEDSLCHVIMCWETLKNELEDRGLTTAVNELNKIFPLFAPTPSEGNPQTGTEVTL